MRQMLEWRHSSIRPPADTKTPDQVRFIVTLNEKTRFNWWIFLLLICASYPGFLNSLNNGKLLYLTVNVKQVRCRIPELEEKDWTFNMIKDVSAPNSCGEQCCECYDLDYSFAKNKTYEESLGYVKNMTDLSLVSCDEYVYKKNRSLSYIYEFDLVCKRKKYVGTIILWFLIGRLIGRALFGMLADMYGRERALSWAIGMLFYTSPIILVARNYNWIIWGRFFMGVASAGAHLCILVNFLEICRWTNRPFCTIGVYFGRFCGHLLSFYLEMNPVQWRYRYLHYMLLLVVLPLCQWFMPESPRWLYVKDQKFRAWSLVMQLKTPGKDKDWYENPVGLRDREIFHDFVWNEIKDIFATLFTTKKLRKWFLLCVFVHTMLFTVAYHAYYLLPRYEIGKTKNFMFVAIVEFMIFLFPFPLLICFGRKLCIMLVVVCSAVGYFALFAMQLYTVQATVAKQSVRLMCMVVSKVAVLILRLFIIETFPTPVRASSLGFSSLLSIFLLVFLHLTHDMIGNYLFMIYGMFGVCALVAMLFLRESYSGDLPDSVDDAVMSISAVTSSDSHN